MLRFAHHPYETDGTILPGQGRIVELAYAIVHINKTQE
jgi:hypothetical protein